MSSSCFNFVYSNCCAFLNYSGEESKYREDLAPEDQEIFMVALNSFKAVCDEMKCAEINKKTLQLICNQVQSFKHICHILKLEGMDAVTDQRSSEMNAFNDEKKELEAFFRVSAMLRGMDCLSVPY